jgi:hypothetical protein
LILQALGQLKAHEAIAITQHLSIIKMGKNNHTSCKKETCSNSVSKICDKDWLLAKNIVQ